MSERCTFIISSGRSGSHLWTRVFPNSPEIRVEHEFAVDRTQALGVKYAMGLIGIEEARENLKSIYRDVIMESDSNIWMDSSNKLAYLIPPLAEVFPEARFVHVVRDGRKVIASFHQKLSEEVYPEEGVRALLEWVRDPLNHPEPPAEKKYWWTIPKPFSPTADDFVSAHQIQRIAFHWRNSNLVAEEDLGLLAKDRWRFFRLEDIADSEETFLDFCEFASWGRASPRFETMKKPHNVIVPIDSQLTAEEIELLDDETVSLLKHYGYWDVPTRKLRYDR